MHFKTGKFAYSFRSQIIHKYEEAMRNETPLDVLPELAVQRAMLAEYIEVVEENALGEDGVSLENLENIVAIAERIGNMATKMATVRNKTAFTNAEIDFIREGLKSGLAKYVDADKQRAFVEHIRKFLPGWNSSGREDG